MCKKCIEKEVSRVGRAKCPFDRQEYSDISSFPVVLSLISLADSSLKCGVHNSPATNYCADDQLFLCGHCIPEHSSHKLLKLDKEMLPELRKWQESTQGRTDQLRDLREEIYASMEKSIKSEEQLSEAFSTYITDLRIELGNVVAEQEAKIESHIEECSLAMKESQHYSSVKVLEEAYSQIDNEISKSDQFFTDFDFLPLSEKLEKFREGAQKPVELTPLSLAPYSQLMLVLSELPNYKSLVSVNLVTSP